MASDSEAAAHGMKARRSADGALADEAAPPRLLIVSAGVYPPDFGGGQLRVHKTLLRLRERYPLTARVLALTGASSQPGWSATDEIPVRRLPARMGSLGMAVSIGRHLRQERRRGVDAVYTMAIGRVVYITAVWARLLGMPLIVEIMNRNLLEKRSRRLMARLLTRSARLVIAISEPVAREIRSLRVPEDRLWVRPNPVDLGRHDLAPAEERRQERRELGCADEDCLHVVAGSISPRKNQLLAVDAFERLPGDHRLVIVGPILPQNTSYARQLEERVGRSPARARIKLQLSFRDDLHRLLRAADCLWLPSHEEGLGNVMLEALCCGVPCIINRDLGMDEHVTNGINGWQSLAEPGAWAGAVEKILPLIRDLDRRRAISAAARERYDAARFDRAFYERVLLMARVAKHRSRPSVEAG